MNQALILNPPVILKYCSTLKWRVILRFFWALTIISVAALTIFYIFQINSQVSGKYSVKQYESQLEEVLIANKRLEVDFIQNNSLNNAVGLVSSLNFEDTNKIEYIRILDNQVVAK